MIVKNQNVFSLFIAALTIIFLAYVIMLSRLFLKIRREEKWIRSLKKDDLASLEDLLSNCLVAHEIRREDGDAIDDIIRKKGFPIKTTLMLSEGRTVNDGSSKKGVYISRFLSSEKRNFTLAHELMHIIYSPEGSDTRRQYRWFHVPFGSRSKDEQTRDYMAASFLLPKDLFWQELLTVDYFSLSPEKRKTFVCEMTAKYGASASTVYRRIDELRVLNGT